MNFMTREFTHEYETIISNTLIMVKEEISIPPIVLEWSAWFAWDDLKIVARNGNGVKVPNGEPGVYEAKYRDLDERLTIGKASDLRMRIKQGLVKGKAPHSAGQKIRTSEDTSRIVIRWGYNKQTSGC